MTYDTGSLVGGLYYFFSRAVGRFRGEHSRRAVETTDQANEIYFHWPCSMRRRRLSFVGKKSTTNRYLIVPTMRFERVSRVSRKEGAL